MFLPDFLTKAPKRAKKAKYLHSKSVELAELNLPDGVVARYSTRAKRLALRMDTKARHFTLVIPKRTSRMRAEGFAWQNDSWIKEQLAALPTAQKFEHGYQVSIMGEIYTITVDYSDAYKRTDIKLDRETCTLHVRTNKSDPHTRIVRFLKGVAKNALSDMAQDKAGIRNLYIKSVSIRDTKSRWGSCSYDGKLSFSWRLILAPFEAIDYVVAHEVAHLVHLDHSKAFWAVCEELSEDYSTGKLWMKSHANELMRF